MDNPSIFDDAIHDIETNKIQFSIVGSGTGSGKTTILPCKLVKFNRRSGNYRRIIVMLPTKEAVRNAYTRINDSKFLDVNVNFTSGFARNSIVSYNNYKCSLISNSVTGYELPKEDNDDTNLVFVTTGHMMRLIREWIKYLSVEDYSNPRSLLTFDYVIIDETHLRSKSMDIDIILGLMKYILIHFPNKGVPSVICTSATYSEPGAKIYNIKDTNPFTKTIEYIPLPVDGYEEKVKILHIGLYGFLQSLNVKFGIALVFLPRFKDILIVKEGLEKEDLFHGLEIVIAHGNRTEAEMKRDVFTKNSPGKWKIILATNIAETSLTIPNISLIVDFGYENIRVVGANKTVHSEVKRIAKDSADQRAGRTGRTCNGLVLRMMSPEEYNDLDDTIVAEIQRLPISNEVLLILDCNVDCRFIFGDRNSGVTRSISDKQALRLTSTLKELAHFKLIRDCNGYYDVTEQGRLVSSLPVSNKAGILIMKAIESGIDLYPVIVLACAIENVDVIFDGPRIQTEYSSSIPFFSILKPWLKLCAKYGTINFSQQNMEKFINFCSENKLNFDGFQDLQKKIVNCITRMRSLNYHVDIVMFDPEDLFIKVRRLLDTTYFSYKLVRENGKAFYKSIIPDLKHKPLFLNDKFLNIPSKFPEKVTAVFNMEKEGRTQMILWYPNEYVAKGNVIDSIVESVIPETIEEDDIPDPDTMESED
jgi:HrpA-like RNA helicase